MTAQGLHHSEVTDADLGMLLPMVGDDRLERMRRVLDRRTRTVTMVMENFSDPHNSAAVLRSVDAFGLQDAHFVGGPYSHHIRQPSKKIARGCERWLTTHTWSDIEAALIGLRAQGYSICVAHVSGEAVLGDVDFTQKTAIWLGNEHFGPSQELLEAADQIFRIPMAGFVESFNVSVAGSICLHNALEMREKHLPDGNGDLTSDEKHLLYRQWVYEDIRHGPAVLEELRRRAESNEPQ